MMQEPKVYIVMLNFRQWEDSRDCLASILCSSYTNFSVVLVDNNSENNSLEHLIEWLENSIYGNMRSTENPIGHILMLRSAITESTEPAKLPKITFIQNDNNDGFAGGNNIALKLFPDQDAYVWLLNPDMTIRENTLEELVNYTVEQPATAVVGATVQSYSGNHELLFYGGGTINFWTATVRMARKTSLIPLLDYISGGCLFTHASNLKRTGLLPEAYFLYWEETDWCYQAKRSGCQLLVCTSAICYDKISTVIGKSFMADYYYVRNGLLFISKYRKKNLPVIIFFNSVRFMKRIITGQWKRAKGVFKGTMDFFKMNRDEAK